MRHLLSFSLLLFLSLSFSACELDAETVKGYVDRLQEDVLPTKEEFRKMAEREIAKLPEEERALALQDLEETIANWPTNEEIDRMIDSTVSQMPSKAEFEKALDESTGSTSLRDAFKKALDEMPEGEELNKLINGGIDQMKESMDSVRMELDKQ
jgi:hypothetical protein